MNARCAYVTIDDSPTPHTPALASYLAAGGIVGLFYCRGDRLEQDMQGAVDAIDKGMVIANHNYSHTPAGALTVPQVVAEIERTETLIDRAYRLAGKTRPGKYFRFPYLDKGDGDRLEQRFGEIIASVETIDLSGDAKVRALQDYLRREGFTQPFKGVTHPLYRNPAVAGAADCLFTYSSCDWMLTPRHLGKWPYRTIDDLKRKIDDDHYLCGEGGAQITLFHDQPDIEGVAETLIDYLKEKGFIFLSLA